MTRLLCRAFGILIFFVAALFVEAAPFDENIEFTQPNGSRIELHGKGDEFYAVFETLDGYTVVFDPDTKAYYYARLSADGMALESTGIRVVERKPQSLNIPENIRVKPEAIRQQVRERFSRWDREMQASRRWTELKAARRAAELRANDGPSMSPPGTTTTGTKVGLCMLIDFDDDPATMPQAEIVNFCNETGYSGYGNNGSVKEYFQDNSGGSLVYSNIVTVYIRIPNSLHPKSWYNDTSKDCGTQGNLLIRDAIAIMKAMPNYETEILPAFEALTVDENNSVQALNVFYAGGNGGVWSYGLWPHSSRLWIGGEQTLSDGGKKLERYQITNIGASLQLGTFCHENGHMLCGFPDIYDYEYDSVGGAGQFCLMDYGGGGGNPAQISAYLKSAAGWATITDVDGNSRRAASLSAGQGPDFNHFYRFHKPGVSTEYFLLENRQATGRDANRPASGIAVWHIDELGDRDNQSLVYNDAHENYEVTLVQADNAWHFENDVNSGDAEDLFYQGNSAGTYQNRFSDDTSPCARWWDGTASGVVFFDFGSSAETMTFVVGSGNNDVFANAWSMEGMSGQTTGDNTGAGKEPGEPDHAGNSGGASVWWVWTTPVSGEAVIDTFGSGFDTLLAVYTGSAVDSLTPAAANDDTGGLQSEVTFTAQAGETYWIAVDGYDGAKGTIKIFFRFRTAMPVITPNGGDIYGDATIEITAAEGATIHYTIDGTEPTTNSPVYVAPFALAGDALVQASAVQDGFSDSEKASASFVVHVATPVIAPDASVIYTNGTVDVTIFCADTNAAIRYTINGSNVTEESSVYSNVFALALPATVKAQAFKEGASPSLQAEQTYFAQQVAKPTFEPVGGVYPIPAAAVWVKITCADTNAQIWYSLNGNGEALYDGTPVLVMLPGTIVAQASEAGKMDSEIAKADYFNAQVEAPVITPASGFYEAPGTVVIANPDSNSPATIRYTIDGSDVTETSTEYTVAFTADVPTVVKAQAFINGLMPSDVTVAQYWFGTVLANDIPVTNLTAGIGGMQEFKFAIPEGHPDGQTMATFTISGGSGECDMIVNFAARATTNDYDYYQALPGNEETVTFDPAAAGDWYVTLIDGGTNGFAGVNLTVSFTDVPPQVVLPVITPAGGDKVGAIMMTLDCATTGAVVRYTLDRSEPTELSAAYTAPFKLDPTGFVEVKAKAFKDTWTVSATASASYRISKRVKPSGMTKTVSGAQGEVQYFTITVPVGAERLVISLTGGTGNGNVWVKRGAFPTLQAFDFRSKMHGNNELIMIPNPKAGKTYNIMLKGKPAFDAAQFSVQVR